MKICIPIKTLHEGGGFYFLGLLKTFLTKSGIPWTEEAQDEYDVLFVNSWQVSYDTIYHLKRSRPAVKVVHRVDGSAQNYGRFDNSDSKQARVNMLADVTIFQSNYGKYSTRNRFKVIRQDGPIIYNPVDIDMFSPHGEKLPLKGQVKVCNAAWSTNPKKGSWQIPQLARSYPDVTFVLCGRYPEKVDLPNVEYRGHLSYEHLAAVMRSCDAYLDPSENECCPNVVLQALASGLPVLHKNSGGVPELVDDAGVTVAADFRNFREALGSTIALKVTMESNARKRAVEYFSPQAIFPKYLSVMQGAQRHPLPTVRGWLRAALQGYPVIPVSWWKSPVRQITRLFRHES